MKQAMNDINQLININKRLDDLYTKLYIAERTRDKRSLAKNIREANTAISDYAATLPPDVHEAFEDEVGANALNYQHADDIIECIHIIENRIQELKQQTNL